MDDDSYLNETFNVTSNLTEIWVQSTETRKWWDNAPYGRIQIPLYATIFLLAVSGNSLVILTLSHHQRMRTITNVFLLNLAVSDLLLGVLCMPFTLVGTLLRDFVFGEFMCKCLPYLQATSVSVSAWTLVAISVERYYAICHPLRSRRWQTLHHAYRLIAVIWVGSFLCMLPIAWLSQLIPTSRGHHKCRENWPDGSYERAYNIFLDVVLLVAPLVILAVTYSLITRTLWRGIKTYENSDPQNQNQDKTLVDVYVNSHGSTTRLSMRKGRKHSVRENVHLCQLHWSQNSGPRSRRSYHGNAPNLRRTNAEKSLLKKKRVIKMLFAVVLEFFICWTPLYVINTIALFNPMAVYNGLGYTAISFFQLLAYTSSCCNPITYCFMNCSFRKSFLGLFRCFKRYREPRTLAVSESELNMEAKWNSRWNSNRNSTR